MQQRSPGATGGPRRRQTEEGLHPNLWSQQQQQQEQETTTKRTTEKTTTMMIATGVTREKEMGANGSGIGTGAGITTASAREKEAARDWLEMARSARPAPASASAGAKRGAPLFAGMSGVGATSPKFSGEASAFAPLGASVGTAPASLSSPSASVFAPSSSFSSSSATAATTTTTTTTSASLHGPVPFRPLASFPVSVMPQGRLSPSRIALSTASTSTSRTLQGQQQGSNLITSATTTTAAKNKPPSPPPHIFGSTSNNNNNWHSHGIESRYHSSNQAKLDHAATPHRLSPTTAQHNSQHAISHHEQQQQQHHHHHSATSTRNERNLQDPTELDMEYLTSAVNIAARDDRRKLMRALAKDRPISEFEVPFVDDDAFQNHSQQQQKGQHVLAKATPDAPTETKNGNENQQQNNSTVKTGANNHRPESPGSVLSASSGGSNENQGGRPRSHSWDTARANAKIAKAKTMFSDTYAKTNRPVPVTLHEKQQAQSTFSVDSLLKELPNLISDIEKLEHWVQQQKQKQQSETKVAKRAFPIQHQVVRIDGKEVEAEELSFLSEPPQQEDSSKPVRRRTASQERGASAPNDQMFDSAIHSPQLDEEDDDEEFVPEQFLKRVSQQQGTSKTILQKRLAGSPSGLQFVSRLSERENKTKVWTSTTAPSSLDVQALSHSIPTPSNFAISPKTAFNSV